MLLGFVGLVVGGELLVRGASSLARSLGVPSLVVGLTVVSFATSAPELTVTLNASLSGTPGLAVGNVVGSNIANILLVLGMAAAVTPLIVTKGVVKRDVPVMIGFTLVLLLVAADATVSSPEGALLLAMVAIYVVVAVWQARRTGEPESTEPESAASGEPQSASPHTDNAPAVDTVPVVQRSTTMNLLLIAVGVALLVVGSQALVAAATSIATALGISDLVIGLTVVALGTSLPELAASIIAVLRGERDIAIGNIVGSNIFNIGLVLGMAAFVTPGGLPVPEAAVAFDIPVLLAVSFALLPVVFTGLAIGRAEGFVLLGYYVAYTGYVLLDANDHDALPRYSNVMAWFVIPITAMTLAVMVTFELRRIYQRRQGRQRQADP